MSYEVVEGTEAVVTQFLDGTPAEIFAAFTDPAIAQRWMWGAAAVNPLAEIDLKIGGRYRISIDAPPGDDSGWPSDRWAMSGVYIVIEAPHRLVYTLHWEGPVGYNQTGDDIADEVAIVSFEEHNGGTKVVYRHIGIPDDGGAAAEHGRSVDATFRDLAALLD